VRSIRKGDRGAAVEDVQRRLLVLGADLGATGVDGVFLGATYAAVAAFQQRHGLDEDGEVGPQTWAALVDATFTLGDRLLYLRFPYLHGADVRTLQEALNSLGFACGDLDGIFGPFTEHATREFQANTGLGGDGIVGPETVRALANLRHVWADRDGQAPAALRTGPARRADVLSRVPVVVAIADASRGLAERFVNLALAAEPGALVRIATGSPRASGVVIEIGPDPTTLGPVVLAGEGGAGLTRRLAAALAAGGAAAPHVSVALPETPTDERALQALAVALLDGVCLGLAAAGTSVLG
jgi:peptidoglycan hydrolase-like protein with peptidoglycan-binding domain